MQPVEHARKGDGLADVFQPADPGHRPLDAHPEAAVRYGAVLAQIEVPLEGFPRQVVLLDALEQQFRVVDALAAADDFPVALGRQHAVIRVRHEVIKAVRDYFDSHGFTLVDTPIFTPAACEGTTTLFQVDYFEDDKAFLTQSGQLYNEATAMAFGKVYCFGPTFRAEKSKTRRHLTEFWMVEPEMAYATLEDVKRVAEELIVFIVGRVLENRREELKRLERDVTKLEAIQAPFPRMSYDDAIGVLQAKGSEIQWGGDFGGTDETLLTEDQQRPIMVDRFPASFKAFYFQPDAERPELVLGVDVLAPEGYGEIIGGGQRIHDPELLLQRIQEHNLPREAFEWYIDLRKYGTVPHGGFGMGIERCVAWICGLEHIRETIAFPRMLYRLHP